MNKHGTPLKSITIQNMTDLLLANCDVSKPPFTVRINWVWNFIQHHNILKTHFSQKYNHQQAFYEDSNKIQKWFKFIQSTIEEWGITDENIYNFNETDFVMSMVTTAKVITQIEKHSHSNLVQSENQKWVTAIEIINASGWVLSLIIIFASKIYCTAWFKNTEISSDWTIAVSDNNWMNNQLDFNWLQSMFESNTKDCTKGIY